MPFFSKKIHCLFSFLKRTLNDDHHDVIRRHLYLNAYNCALHLDSFEESNSFDWRNKRANKILLANSPSRYNIGSLDRSQIPIPIKAEGHGARLPKKMAKDNATNAILPDLDLRACYPYLAFGLVVWFSFVAIAQRKKTVRI
eukprot:TRINITY_DN15549_c0_g1_i1.p1 TRINITY_DN15549_c0_g1~~TRINITY_DN15549_c0_g1_i1.p1  ORF type:complete len:142 (-),score=4.93 TRINITY_DN15549_c0_g1_i1:8-433(-)